MGLLSALKQRVKKQREDKDPPTTQNADSQSAKDSSPQSPSVTTRQQETVRSAGPITKASQKLQSDTAKTNFTEKKEPSSTKHTRNIVSKQSIRNVTEKLKKDRKLRFPPNDLEEETAQLTHTTNDLNTADQHNTASELHDADELHESSRFNNIQDRNNDDTADGPTKKEKLKNIPFDIARIKREIEQSLSGDKLQQSHALQGHPRLSTGIPGLDEVIEGGIRFGSATLIGGGAGSGKSIFAMQFLVNGILSANEAGVYISFEQTEKEILESFEPFNWNIEQKITDKQLALVHNTPEQVEKVLESGGGVVRDIIGSINAKRVVIDSLSAFSLLFKTDFEKRRALLRLFEAIRGWGCTTLMISEQEPDPENHMSTILEFAVDGVILLYNLRKGDIRERSLEVFKMRATDHQQKIFPMRIDQNGITIFPDEVVF